MKKKMRFGAATLISIVLVLCAALSIVACDCGKDDDDDGADAPRVSVTSYGVDLNFTEVEGAKEYAVYHSESRYGNYEHVKTQSSRSFTHPDSYGYFRIDALDAEKKTISSELLAYDIETFGENTHIYAETDDHSKIQQDLDAFMSETGQFSSKRFAALFKKGRYNDLDLQMSYYTHYAGLGELPTDVEIGKFNVYAELSGNNATCNFWRGIENFTVNDNVLWAVSQATSLRRMQINGNIQLTHSDGTNAWGSGGFIADTVVTGTVNAQNQQQWLTRNTSFNRWNNSDINMVFSGCEGSFSGKDYVWPTRRITDIKNTKIMREKPFLIFDDNFGYTVVLPALETETSGTSWTGQGASFDYLPLDGLFYVARSDKDTADTLNAALSNGKHILFTPGIYNIDKPLKVEKKDTVIMGIGLATLKVSGGNRDALMKIADVDGVNVSGLIFDAGEYTSTLLTVGGETKSNVRHSENPIVLSDVYFRIGGAENVKTEVDTTLLINANDVVGDNFWVWRADHSYGVAWDMNVTKNGVVINGDYVTIYGLMVEHFHEYQTIWNGENGYMVFYQSETPYDVPDQTDPSEADKWVSVWNQVEYQGYASYKVSDNVRNHEAYGLGVYYVTRGNTFVIDHGIEAPANEGIHIEHMAIANFSTARGGGIAHIINDRGTSVVGPNPPSQKTQFTSYIGGNYVS